MTGLALTVGIPLGVVAGHWSWRLFAKCLGIPGDFVTPAAARSAHGARGDPRGQCRRELAGQDGRAGEPGAGAPGATRGRGKADILAETHGRLAVASRGG